MRLPNFLMIQEEIANAIGLKESVVVMIIDQQCRSNEKNKEFFYDGHWWAKLSYSAIANRYRFMGTDEGVQSMVLELESPGILISRIFNDFKPDRAKWYRVNHSKLDDLIAKLDDQSLLTTNNPV